MNIECIQIMVFEKHQAERSLLLHVYVLLEYLYSKFEYKVINYIRMFIVFPNKQNHCISYKFIYSQANEKPFTTYLFF